MGRLLLALDLSQVLSPIAWLSLSATISNRKEQYYRAFADSEHPLNRGEITAFVEIMLDIVTESLGDLRQDLAARSDQFDGLQKRMQQLSIASPAPDGELDDDLRAVLFILGQASLFGPVGSLTLDELARNMERSKQFVRPPTLNLEELGLIETVSKRPLRFRLTSQGNELLGLVDPLLALVLATASSVIDRSRPVQKARPQTKSQTSRDAPSGFWLRVSHSFNTYAACLYWCAIRDSDPGTTDLALFNFVLSLLIAPGVEAALHLVSR